MLPWCLATLLPVLATHMAAAQDAGVELRLESNTLEVGEAVDGQLICTNIGQPEAPAIRSQEGIDVQIISPAPAQFSQTTIVNNRRSQKVTYTFSLRVVAKKEGVFTIGPIAVAADGATYQTAPVQVAVRKGAAFAQNDADRLVFVRISAEPKSVYVTETVTATLLIGIRKVEIAGEVANVDNLLQFVDGRGSDISIFPTRFSSSEQWMTDSTGRRHQYVLHRATREMRAEEVGPLAVGPVFLRMNYPTEFRRGFFGGLEAARSRKETARAEAIIIEVKGPLEQGRPADFTGAIGQFTLSVDVKPTRIEHGRPVTLSIAISGEPVEGLAGPDLSRQSELASRFDFATDELTGDTEGRAKVFRRAVFAKQPGEQTIPPITWSYFDPKTERYVSLASKPIAIVVDPPAAGSAPMVSLPSSDVDGGSAKLTVLSGGIAPNYVDSGLVLADHSLRLSGPMMTAVFAVPPMAWAVVTLLVRQQRRVMTDVGYSRRRRAKRQAHRRIGVALRQPTSGEQLSGLAHALTGFVSDRFDLPSGETTPQEVRTALAGRGLNSSFSDEVAAFLESCDAARYAPGVLGSLSAEQAAVQVRNWIARIDRSAR